MLRQLMDNDGEPLRIDDTRFDEALYSLCQHVIDEGEELVDELYCQLMRQLNHNGNAESRRKGSLVLDVLAGLFVPAHELVRSTLFEFVRRSRWTSHTHNTLHKLRALTRRVSAPTYTKVRWAMWREIAKFLFAVDVASTFGPVGSGNQRRTTRYAGACAAVHAQRKAGAAVCRGECRRCLSSRS